MSAHEHISNCEKQTYVGFACVRVCVFSVQQWCFSSGGGHTDRNVGRPGTFPHVTAETSKPRQNRRVSGRTEQQQPSRWSSSHTLVLGFSPWAFVFVSKVHLLLLQRSFTPRKVFLESTLTELHWICHITIDRNGGNVLSEYYPTLQKLSGGNLDGGTCWQRVASSHLLVVHTHLPEPLPQILCRDGASDSSVI